jgi:hypothetical protein
MADTTEDISTGDELQTVDFAAGPHSSSKPPAEESIVEDKPLQSKLL